MKTKLHIENLTLLKNGGNWYSLVFTGANDQYSKLCKDLGKEKHFSAYWHPGLGWVISAAILPKYADRFDNYQQKLGEAQAAEKGFAQ